MWDNEIERMFQDEIRSKKRISSGARHNSGRRGGSSKGIKGSLHMPSEWLRYTDKKAYKAYIRGGEIQMSNVLDDISNIPNIIELGKKEFKSAQSIVKTAKEKHTTKELCKHWEVTSYSLYKLFRTYEVEYATHKRKSKALPKEEAWKTSGTTFAEEQRKILQESKLLQENQKKINGMDAESIAKPINLPSITEEEFEEFQLKYIKKEVNGKEIQDRIMNYIGILFEDKKYEVKLVIRELPEKTK